MKEFDSLGKLWPISLDHKIWPGWLLMMNVLYCSSSQKYSLCYFLQTFPYLSLRTLPLLAGLICFHYKLNVITLKPSRSQLSFTPNLADELPQPYFFRNLMMSLRCLFLGCEAARCLSGSLFCLCNDSLLNFPDISDVCNIRLKPHRVCEHANTSAECWSEKPRVLVPVL